MTNNLNDGKVNISINKGEKDELTPQDKSEPSVETKDVEKTSLKSKAINAALLSAGKDVIVQGIDIYSKMSGNTTLKTNLTNLTTGLTDIGIIATGGPVGAIAVASKYILGAANAYADSVLENKQIDYDNKQLGIISREGSRYF